MSLIYSILVFLNLIGPGATSADINAATINNASAVQTVVSNPTTLQGIPIIDPNENF